MDLRIQGLRLLDVQPTHSPQALAVFVEYRVEGAPGLRRAWLTVCPRLRLCSPPGSLYAATLEALESDDADAALLSWLRV